ncbi:FeoA family protein [Ekhidna sp.]|uniref:FeoA family protein n=1 Tax=Ekhidna sp. TaxID=2608089 RepID=UPI003C7C77CA
MSKLSFSPSSTPQTIAHIEESDLKDRLYEMGVYPDQIIEIVRKAPFGDPLIVKVGGQLIMLRQNEADLITIKEN